VGETVISARPGRGKRRRPAGAGRPVRSAASSP